MARIPVPKLLIIGDETVQSAMPRVSSNFNTNELVNEKNYSRALIIGANAAHFRSNVEIQLLY